MAAGAVPVGWVNSGARLSGRWARLFTAPCVSQLFTEFLVPTFGMERERAGCVCVCERLMSNVTV